MHIMQKFCTTTTLIFPRMLRCMHVRESEHSNHLLADGSSTSSSSDPTPTLTSCLDSLLRLLPACLVPLPCEVLPLPADLPGKARLLGDAVLPPFFLPVRHNTLARLSLSVSAFLPSLCDNVLLNKTDTAEQWGKSPQPSYDMPARRLHVHAS